MGTVTGSRLRLAWCLWAIAMAEILTGFALASVVDRRLPTVPGIEREQLKWFLYASALLLVGKTAAPAAVALVRSDLASNAAAYTEPLVTGLPAIAAGVAILRFRLVEIDRLINRTLVYGCLTTILPWSTGLAWLCCRACCVPSPAVPTWPATSA